MKINRKCIRLVSKQKSPHFAISQQIFFYDLKTTLVKVLCFSVDPVMKVWMSGARTNFRQINEGDIFNCFGLGQVQHCGQYIFGNLGTCSWSQLNQQKSRQCFVLPKQLVQMYGRSNFIYLINNGLAAYSGIQMMKPQIYDTVVVSTAAGATGLLVCELLKAMKVPIIAITSTNKLKEVQKYTNNIIDYKKQKQMHEKLKNSSFRCYFDNVGQSQLDLILSTIQPKGVISLCGAIENYSQYKTRKGLLNYSMIILKQLSLKGINFSQLIPRAFQIFKKFENINLKIIEIIPQDFEQYFENLLTSGNNIIGKIIVKFINEDNINL